MNKKLIKRCNSLVITTSKQCNGSCDYCLFKPQENEYHEKFISLQAQQALINIINSYDLSNIKLPYKIKVYIIGGEPLLYIDKLCNLIELFIKNCPNILFTFNIFTNGCIITEKMLKQLIKYPVFFTFSLDEVDINLTHRKYQNKSMYEFTKESILIANKICPQRINVNTVLSETTFKTLPKLYAFLKSNNIKNWGWGFMRLRTPEEAMWSEENFNELKLILENIIQDSLNYNIELYSVLEYGGISAKDFTSEDIDLYLNLDETIGTISGDNAFRVPIQNFKWKNYFSILSSNLKLYNLDDNNHKLNYTECHHCHYRELCINNQMIKPHTQCLYEKFMQEMYKKYYAK